MERIKTETPNIVLLDIMLSGMSGLEVLQLIKKNYDGLPVIIVSALGDEKSIEKAMNLGAVDYLTKPFDVCKIRNAVGKILNRGTRHIGTLTF